MAATEASISPQELLQSSSTFSAPLLLIAAACGYLDVVKELLGRDDAQIFQRTLTGRTALHRAAAYGHVHVVEALLAARPCAELDSADAEGATPLCRAARWGHVDVVVALLRAGADPDVADASGRAPLAWAVAKGFDDVAAALAPEGGVRPERALLAPSASPARVAAAVDVDTASAAAAAASAAAENDAEERPRAAQFLGVTSDDDGAGNDDGDDYDNDTAAGGAYESGAIVPGVPLRVEGWMAKQGHFLRNWKNRWFVLEGRDMHYYTREGARRAQGVIRLCRGSDVIVEERYPKPFCFTIITPTKKFILQAADENEMIEWLEAIQNNVECCLDEEGPLSSAMSDEE